MLAEDGPDVRIQASDLRLLSPVGIWSACRGSTVLSSSQRVPMPNTRQSLEYRLSASEGFHGRRAAKPSRSLPVP